MGITDNLRKQHLEILKSAGQITENLNAKKLSKDAARIHRLLAELAEDINFHLKKEDEVLYPALLRHPEERVRLKARKFLDEMEVTLEIFKKYLEKWSDSSTIQSAPEEFANDTRSIFDALSKRIDNEDNELYPLVER